MSIQLLAARARMNHQTPAGIYFDPAQLGAGIVLSDANARATKTLANNWTSVKSKTSHNSGKWYAECLVDVNSSSGYLIFGIGNASAPLTSYPGSDNNGTGDQCTNTGGARIYQNAHAAVFTGFIGAGGICRIAADITGGNLWFGDSNSGGRWLTGNPSTGATPTAYMPLGVVNYLMLGIYSSPISCVLKNNPSENAFPIPTGYSMWS